MTKPEWVDPLPEYTNRPWTTPANIKIGKPTNQHCTVPHCTRPAPNSAVCAWCTDDLEIALADTPALIEDLTIATTKQARFRSQGGKSGSAKTTSVEWAKIGGRYLEPTTYTDGTYEAPASETARRVPVPYDRRAGRTWTQLSRAIVAAAKAVADRRGARLEVTDPVRLSRYLLAHIGVLTQHADAGALTAAVLIAAEKAHAVIDRPKDSIYIGICRTDHCRTPLHADPDSAWHECGTCHETYDVNTARNALLDKTHDALVTATELVDVAKTHGHKVTRKMIEGYVARGRIVARGKRGRVAVYRVGDLLELLDEREKVSA